MYVVTLFYDNSFIHRRKNERDDGPIPVIFSSKTAAHEAGLSKLLDFASLADIAPDIAQTRTGGNLTCGTESGGWAGLPLKRHTEIVAEYSVTKMKHESLKK